MDMDVGNTHMLQAGAFAYYHKDQRENWQPMSTAPRDGTIIEVRCTYGVAPWYGLHRWTDTMRTPDQNGEIHEWKNSRPQWVGIGDKQNSSFEEGPTFMWRPYVGDAGAYVDPTGGAQNSPAYWRGAAAAERGLPVDYFETPTALRRGFWSRLFGL